MISTNKSKTPLCPGKLKFNVSHLFSKIISTFVSWIVVLYQPYTGVLPIRGQRWNSNQSAEAQTADIVQVWRLNGGTTSHLLILIYLRTSKIWRSFGFWRNTLELPERQALICQIYLLYSIILIEGGVATDVERNITTVISKPVYTYKYWTVYTIRCAVISSFKGTGLYHRPTFSSPFPLPSILNRFLWDWTN